MRQRGMSLIEILVTVAIAGVLLGLGLRSFNGMIATNQTRAAAESILSGLRSARSEAIRRNRPMRFQLVNNLTAACDYSTSSPVWVITQTDWVINALVTGSPGDGKTHGQVRVGATGYCNAQPYTPPDQPDPCVPDVPTGTAAGNRPEGNPATCSEDPWIHGKSAATANPNTIVQANAAVVTFGPLGQVLTNLELDTSLTEVNVSSTNSEAKAWRIRVTPAIAGVNPSGGGIKFCDPSLAAGLPLACS